MLTNKQPSRIKIGKFFHLPPNMNIDDTVNFESLFLSFQKMKIVEIEYMEFKLWQLKEPRTND